MRNPMRSLSIAIAAVVLSRGMPAQGSKKMATADQVTGEVTALAAKSGQISLKTDKGDAVIVIISGGTVFRKVPPGAQSLSAAARIDFSAVGVGDRIVAIGQRSEDQKKVEARSVIVMSRSDLDKKRQAEQEEWQRRGVSGTVSAVDPEAKTFAIKAGSRNVTIQPAATARYRRYAPGSVKFSDARQGSFADVQVGDQVRVLGDKSGDGTTVVAEWIVSGTFRQIAATITSLNAQIGEIVVKDLTTRKTLTVRVNADSTMRRVPPALAALLARRYQPGGAHGATTSVVPRTSTMRKRPGAATWPGASCTDQSAPR